MCIENGGSHLLSLELDRGKWPDFIDRGQQGPVVSLRDNLWGDGRVTVALLDIGSRVATHVGTGSGLSAYRLGQTACQERIVLIVPELPAHKCILGQERPPI